MKQSQERITASLSKEKIYEFAVNKEETFWYGGNDGPVYKANYQFQIQSKGDGLYEGFYPSTVFCQMKGLKDIQDILQSTRTLESRTLVYQLDYGGHRIYLENLEQLQGSSVRDLDRLRPFLTVEQFDDVELEVERALEHADNIEKYLLQDLINLHYCEGLEIEDDYLLDLGEKENFIGALKKRALQRMNLNFDAEKFFKFQRSHPEAFIVSIFKVRNAFTTLEIEGVFKGKKQLIDFDLLKDNFTSDKLDFEELLNGVYSLDEYQISKESHILSSYVNRLKINSKKMRNDWLYTIQRMDPGLTK